MSTKQSCICDTRDAVFEMNGEYKDFYQNVKASLLLALLEKNYISRWEYDDYINSYKGREEESQI